MSNTSTTSGAAPTQAAETCPHCNGTGINQSGHPCLLCHCTGYRPGTGYLPMADAASVAAATVHAVTAEQAVAIVEQFRSILYRSTRVDGSDVLDPAIDDSVDNFEYLAGVLEDAGLAPVAAMPYQPVTLIPLATPQGRIGVRGALDQARESARVAELDLREALGRISASSPAWFVLYDLIEPMTKIAARLQQLSIVVGESKEGGAA